MIASKLDDLAYQWAAAWSDTNVEQFLDLFTSKAVYTDHPFLVRAVGREAIGKHFHIWKTCHTDFKMTVVEIYPPKDLEDSKRALTFRTHNTGTFIKDLPKRKATGERFWFYGAVDFIVDADNKIESVNEWYSTDFYEIKEGIDQYRTQGKLLDKSS